MKAMPTKLIASLWSSRTEDQFFNKFSRTMVQHLSFEWNKIGELNSSLCLWMFSPQFLCYYGRKWIS